MSFRYCPYYCEENAWHLCSNPVLGKVKREVVVISNALKQVAVWRQKASPYGGGVPVLWDYHVLVVTLTDGGTRIWDLDSTMGLDIEAKLYLGSTFQRTPSEYAPWFRIVQSEDYRALFASDRRHMMDEQGQYSSPPPAWAPIGRGHNLHQFVDMHGRFIGDVVDLGGLYQRWNVPYARAVPD